MDVKTSRDGGTGVSSDCGAPPGTVCIHVNTLLGHRRSQGDEDMFRQCCSSPQAGRDSPLHPFGTVLYTSFEGHYK